MDELIKRLEDAVFQMERHVHGPAHIAAVKDAVKILKCINERKPAKAIELCGDCGFYSWKKHKCTRGASDYPKSSEPFYRDCPLPSAIVLKEM
jgi:hypothetical protein